MIRSSLDPSTQLTPIYRDRPSSPVASTALAAVMVLIGACLAANTAGAASATVRLREESLVSGPLVHVGDIAEVTADNAFLTKKISELDLTRVAAPPTPNEVSEPTIVERRLVEARIALADLGDVRVSVDGPETAVVRVPSSGDIDTQFRDVLRRALATQLRAEEKDLRVDLIDSVDMRALLDRGIGRLELEPRLPTTPRLGRQRIPVELRESNQLVRTVNVSLDLKWYTSVMVATREIATAEILSAADVESVTRWIDQLDHHTDAELLVGHAVQRAFRAGEVIRAADVRRAPIETEYLVQPRDVVRIVAQRGPLRVIVMDGEVLQRGRKGDTIRVRNPSSKATLTARVVDRTEVVVAF